MKFPISFHGACWRLVILSLLLLAVGAPRALAQGAKAKPLGLKLSEIKFFEHAGGEVAAEAGIGKKYASRFPVSRTRSIVAEVVFENLLLREKKEREYLATIGLYTFDNKLISAKQKPVRVAADWKFAWATQSFGWSEAGRWPVGTYRLKAWLGTEKLGEAAIYLEDDSEALTASGAGITVGDLELYEGGSFFRPGPGEVAASSFARSKVRRIYWVLRGENLLHQQRAQRPNVVGYFYRPDGTLLGETANRYVIAPEMEEVVLVEGFGWATAGEWEPGTYRFELEQDHRVVAEKSFEITDPFLKPRDRPQVIHYGILDAGVFAVGREAPPDEVGRKYANRFAADETESIWAELVLVNNPNHTEPHSHRISWHYYQPDGGLLGKTESVLTVLPEWKTARQKASVAWDRAGDWQPGAYKVRIVIDGKLSRVLRFEVSG